MPARKKSKVITPAAPIYSVHLTPYQNNTDHIYAGCPEYITRHVLCGLDAEALTRISKVHLRIGDSVMRADPEIYYTGISIHKVIVKDPANLLNSIDASACTKEMHNDKVASLPNLLKNGTDCDVEIAHYSISSVVSVSASETGLPEYELIAYAAELDGDTPGFPKSFTWHRSELTYNDFIMYD